MFPRAPSLDSPPRRRQRSSWVKQAKSDVLTQFEELEGETHASQHSPRYHLRSTMRLPVAEIFRRPDGSYVNRGATMPEMSSRRARRGRSARRPRFLPPLTPSISPTHLPRKDDLLLPMLNLNSLKNGGEDADVHSGDLIRPPLGLSSNELHGLSKNKHTTTGLFEEESRKNNFFRINDKTAACRKPHSRHPGALPPLRLGRATGVKEDLRGQMRPKESRFDFSVDFEKFEKARERVHRLSRERVAERSLGVVSLPSLCTGSGQTTVPKMETQTTPDRAQAERSSKIASTDQKDSKKPLVRQVVETGTQTTPKSQKECLHVLPIVSKQDLNKKSQIGKFPLGDVDNRVLKHVASFLGVRGLVLLSRVCSSTHKKLGNLAIKARTRLLKNPLPVSVLLPPIDATIRKHSSVIADIILLGSNLPAEVIMDEDVGLGLGFGCRKKKQNNSVLWRGGGGGGEDVSEREGRECGIRRRLSFEMKEA